MTSRFVVYMTNCSPFGEGPTADQILRFFRSVRTGGYWGDYVGPAPRIVRDRLAGGTCLYRVQATWLFQAPVTNARDDQALREQMNRALRTAAEDLPHHDLDITVQAYNEQTHGPISFWAGGEAARSSDTRDDWRSVLDQRPPDNPIGPNSAQARPPSSALDTLLGVGTFFKENAVPLVVGTAGIMSLYYFGGAARRYLEGGPLRAPYPEYGGSFWSRGPSRPWPRSRY